MTLTNAGFSDAEWEIYEIKECLCSILVLVFN